MEKDKINELSLFTIEECAEVLRLHRASISRLIKSRELRCVDLGARKLVRRDDLVSFIERRTR